MNQFVKSVLFGILWSLVAYPTVSALPNLQPSTYALIGCLFGIAIDVVVNIIELFFE